MSCVVLRCPVFSRIVIIMTHGSIKNSITSLKNKLFSFFKIKDKSKNVVNVNVNANTNTNANTNANNKNEINKITCDYSSKEMDPDADVHTDVHTYVEKKIVIEKEKDTDTDTDTGTGTGTGTGSRDNDLNMIHASFAINDIIDKIVTNTYGSCDKNAYVTNISDFYINNLDYTSFQRRMSITHYYEFTKHIEAILHRNIDIMYNLRSIKLYDNDLNYCNYRAGVFKTDNFIIKIDTDSFNFKNEIVGMYNLGKGLIEEHSIVLPCYVHFSSKKKKGISFSIQPRIHNTISLRDWMLIYANQSVDIEFYIRMCVSICKSILFINSKHVVHGDIKPDNIIVEYTTNRPYIIDFGLCGLHYLSEGTGGTKPFCHPDTTNTDDNYKNSEQYNWVKNTKNNDLWSVSFIFATILIFRKCYIYYKDYPSDFFNDEKYVSINYLNYIPDKFRNPFVYVLTKGETGVSIDIQSFISLLEKAL